MTLTSARLWPCHHCLPTRYGFEEQFPFLLSDQGRRNYNISNLKYYEFHKKISTKASKNNQIISSKKYDILVRSYSQLHHEQQRLDSNVPARHGGFPKLLRATYEFSRPYTVIMAIINVISAAILPLRSLAEVNPAFLIGVLQVLAVNILARVYASGINEIYDIELDKINKPYLPIASGALSMELAVAIVSTCLLGSVALGIMLRSPPLIFFALVSGLLGTLYSVELPFMRWKRNPVLAITVLVLHTAISIPFSTFFHIQKYVLGSPTMSFSRSLILTSCFMTSNIITLGFFKDIPDILGDKKHGVRTLAVRLGAKRVFWICISALILTYGCVIGVGLTSSSLITKLVIVPGHLSMACILLYRAVSVDLSVDGAAHGFFMFLWSLTCVECLLIPFVR